MHRQKVTGLKGKKVVIGKGGAQAASVAKILRQERVVTTRANAKTLSSVVDHIVAEVKVDDSATRRRILALVHDERAVESLFKSLAPLKRDSKRGYSRGKGRNNRGKGGYTLITDIGKLESNGPLLVTVEIRVAPKDKRIVRRKHSRPAIRVEPQVDVIADPMTRSEFFIANFNAVDRGELEEIAQTAGMKVFGFGRVDNYVLASRMMRGIDEEPAFLQLSRTGIGMPHPYRFSASWLGAPPDLEDAIGSIRSALKGKESTLESTDPSAVDE